MKCDLCDKEATVHEWTKKAGQKVEKHLCEECARKQGVAIQPQQQISQLITQLISGAKPGAQQPAQLNPTVQVGACPTCGTTYAQFRHSGLLGCPGCYQTFESQLGPLLQRAHEGGTHHAGKVPHLAKQPAAPPPPPRAPAAQASPARPMVPQPAAAAPAPAPAPSTEAVRAERIKRLRAQLNEAVAAEQYEKAAKIRDELAKLEAHQPRPPSPSPGAKPNP